jgi:hypothetical protein
MAEPWLARRPVRPPYLSRGVWPLLLLADRLPYPWGEDLVARLFVVKAFVQRRPLRRALAWAACHRARPRARWRLALACCAYQGRFVARHALVGVRHPDQFRRQVVLEGAEHIAAGGGPTTFLAFHLGPPDTAVALRLLGHSLTWVGGANWSRASISEAWRAYHEPGGMLAASAPTATPAAWRSPSRCAVGRCSSAPAGWRSGVRRARASCPCCRTSMDAPTW